MDVTSLLNANSMAAEQQKKADLLKTPTRNRTPWDAGGYSLPINTVSNNPSTPPQTIHYDDSQTDTPRSPHHKFSDSRSSLSSFTSSLQSATHSRFSSMSTVNSAHPFNSILADGVHHELGMKQQIFELGHLSLSIDGSLTATRCTIPRGSISPTGSLDALARVAENRLVGEQAECSAQQPDGSIMEENIIHSESMSGPQRRPSSPSDAILIKRSTVPCLRLITGDQDFNGFLQAPRQDDYRSAFLESRHQSLLHSKSHKRALSAPDFSAVNNNFSITGSSSIGPKAEPTPPSSHHPDNPSPSNAPNYPAPDTPPMTTMEAQAPEVVCMYIPNCDTGSQLRKAISHIFGRNKMCTRLIPSHVWVHYCRKHYQRSRYRNPKEYAKLQCDLVQQQIRRVHEWSLSNTKKGSASVVQDWGLAVRKREQKRLDDLGGTNRKRPASTFDNDSDDGDDGTGRSYPVPATAVPSWLLKLCGKGYSTQAILEIFNRLHTEILNDVMHCFPDIEILPNIVVDQDEPKSPKGYAKRTPVSGHKRSQSLGVGMKPEYYGGARRLSQPAIWDQDTSPDSLPLQKRRRPNDMISGTNSPGRALPPFRARLSERPIETGRRSHQVVHRPVFANIDEHQTGEDDYYATSPQAYRTPLQAPVPQRLNGHSMAAHLESNNDNVYSMRRPLHQRSQSDMGAFARDRASYSPTPESSLRVRQSPFHDHGVGGNGHNSQHQWDSSASQALPSSESRVSRHLPGLQGYGHSRHQSTPTAHPFSAQGMSETRDSQLSAGYIPYSSQGRQALSDSSHIIETQQARALYTSRR